MPLSPQTFLAGFNLLDPYFSHAEDSPVGYGTVVEEVFGGFFWVVIHGWCCLSTRFDNRLY